MAKQSTMEWTTEDSVALRAFFAKVPMYKLSTIMASRCPATITPDILLGGTGADAVARIASMGAGWDAYEQALFGLTTISTQPPATSGYRDMSTQ